MPSFERMGLPSVTVEIVTKADEKPCPMKI
jgi:hypothetical protein